MCTSHLLIFAIAIKKNIHTAYFYNAENLYVFFVIVFCHTRSIFFKFYFNNIISLTLNNLTIWCLYQGPANTYILYGSHFIYNPFCFFLFSLYKWLNVNIWPQDEHFYSDITALKIFIVLKFIVSLGIASFIIFPNRKIVFFFVLLLAATNNLWLHMRCTHAIKEKINKLWID